MRSKADDGALAGAVLAEAWVVGLEVGVYGPVGDLVGADGAGGWFGHGVCSSAELVGWIRGGSRGEGVRGESWHTQWTEVLRTVAHNSGLMISSGGIRLHESVGQIVIRAFVSKPNTQWISSIDSPLVLGNVHPILARPGLSLTKDAPCLI